MATTSVAYTTVFKIMLLFCGEQWNRTTSKFPRTKQVSNLPLSPSKFTLHFCAPSETRTHTLLNFKLPPQGSASTDFAISAYSIYKDFPLSIGAYLKLFIQAISRPPRLGLEPRLSTISFCVFKHVCGVCEDRTRDLLLARQVF